MKQFIIDGFNLAYRSHFAFKNLTTASGLVSGGVYGFLTALRALRKRFSYCKFYIVWDNNASKKKEIFSEYKANRIPFRVDLPIKDLKEALQYVNIIQAEVTGEEADDVMASLASHADDLCYIYTSDKDLLQMVVDGRIIVISPKRGDIPEKSYDEEAVKVKYGVEPKDLACYFALRGDDVDNIPGVPRVPSKVLASLCNKYKVIENMYDGLVSETLTDFQRQSLTNFKNQVLINYSLTLLKKDLNCDLTTGKSDPEKFQSFLDKYEIKALTSESYIELFSVDTDFLIREGPSLKQNSFFDE